jgi:hypothetical protein
MINGVNSSGRYITVSGGFSPKPNISPGASGAGMLRWNPNMHQIEVNDGNTWIAISMNHATIELTPETEEILEWARERRRWEEKLKELCKRYPALKKAQDNYELILNIVRDEHENQI